MTKKALAFSIITGLIGGLVLGLISTFIKHWDPLLRRVFEVCFYAGIGSFCAWKAGKFQQKELKKRHQQKENENA